MLRSRTSVQNPLIHFPHHTVIYYYILQYITLYYNILLYTTVFHYILQYITIVLQYITIYYNILLHTTIYYYILQYIIIYKLNCPALPVELKKISKKIRFKKRFESLLANVTPWVPMGYLKKVGTFDQAV